MEFSEVVTVIKDLALTFAAIAGAVAAMKGLSTWRRQLRGQVEYELLRRLLVGLFKYRDAMNDARSPLMLPSEKPAPPEELVKSMRPEQIEFYGTEKAYQNRWKEIRNQRAQLYPNLLEAEAIWGNELGELFQIVRKLEYGLRRALERYLRERNPDNESKEGYGKVLDEVYETIFDNPGSAYSKDFCLAIEKVEAYLKKKMAHDWLR